MKLLQIVTRGEDLKKRCVSHFSASPTDSSDGAFRLMWGAGPLLKVTSSVSIRAGGDFKNTISLLKDNCFIFKNSQLVFNFIFIKKYVKFIKF